MAVLVGHLHLSDDSDLTVQPDIPAGFNFQHYKRDIVKIVDYVCAAHPMCYIAATATAMEDINSATEAFISIRAGNVFLCPFN